MPDPETTSGGPEQQGGDDNQRRDPWWYYTIDLPFYCLDVVGWLIGGVLRACAWVAAAVLSSCN